MTIRTVVRDTLSGRFTKRGRAQSAPSRTVTETVDDGSDLAQVRWAAGELVAVLLTTAGTLERVARELERHPSHVAGVRDATAELKGLARGARVVVADVEAHGNLTAA